MCTSTITLVKAAMAAPIPRDLTWPRSFFFKYILHLTSHTTNSLQIHPRSSFRVHSLKPFQTSPHQPLNSSACSAVVSFPLPYNRPTFFHNPKQLTPTSLHIALPDPPSKAELKVLSCLFPSTNLCFLRVLNSLAMCRPLRQKPTRPSEGF